MYKEGENKSKKMRGKQFKHHPIFPIGLRQANNFGQNEVLRDSS